MKKSFLLVVFCFCLVVPKVFALNNNYSSFTLDYYLNQIMNEDGTYPDYYGGIYYDSFDSEKIILKIVESNLSKDNKKLIDDISKFSNINIVYSKYSYNYLKQKSNSINHSNVNNSSYIGNYIDIENDKIIIELNKDDSLSCSSKLLVKNNSLISYVFTDAFVENKLKKGPGSNISGGCSMAFRTKYKGENGYVTAGHCIKGKYSRDGKVTIKKNEGDSDYAFVQSGNKYDLTNTLKYPGNGVKELEVSNYTPFVFVNSTVGKSGMKTGFTSGKIYTTDYSIVYEGIEYYDLVCAYMKSEGGDSGGAVFGFKNGNAVLYGILKGGKKDGSSTCFMNVRYIDGDLIRGRY